MSICFLFKKGGKKLKPHQLAQSLFLCNLPKCIDQMFSSAGLLVVQKTRNQALSSTPLLVCSRLLVRCMVSWDVSLNLVFCFTLPICY